MREDPHGGVPLSYTIAGATMQFSRRNLLKAGATSAALLSSTGSSAFTNHTEPFTERGYYITFMRGPLFTLDVWKQIFDDVKLDGGNMVVLWMAGAFRSEKFPITWRYNAEHQNVHHNFAGQLIDYGHSLGLKVLLCLTPYAYDGTNQFALEHPDLKGIDHNGNFAKKSGLDAWGFNLNLWKAEHFMLEYTREMLDFYPQADGLLLESSDYAISYCTDCRDGYYEREFAFVRRISDELWQRKPDATIVVYPHYFTGTDVPGMQAKAARERFDPRWTLFFTPHSAYLDPALIRLARSSLYWDPSPTFGRPALIRSAALTARTAGVTGYLASLEPWNYVFSGPDMGAQFLVGSRCSPFGQGWLEPGQLPTRTLLLRMDRLAYRLFSQSPSLSMDEFRTSVSEHLFEGRATPTTLDDMLFLDETFFLDRTWDSTCAIASPDYIKGRLDIGELSPAKLREYQERRRRVARIAETYRTAELAGAREMSAIATWITENWNHSAQRDILADHLRS